MLKFAVAVPLTGPLKASMQQVLLTSALS